VFAKRLLNLGVCLFAGVSASAAFAQTERDCIVAEFRTIALETHDPNERDARAQDWIKKNAQSCSLAKINFIGANRPAWMGAADNPRLAGMIDVVIEAKLSENPALLSQLSTLYGPGPSAPAPRQSTSISTTDLRRPQTAPVIIAPPAAGPVILQPQINR
jgi:hypothetical protein